MKCFRKNNILIVLCLIVGGFSYFEFQKSENQELQKIKSEKLFLNLNKQMLSAIHFQLSLKNKFQLVKKEDGWFVAGPKVQDSADKAAVNIFLNKIFAVKKQAVSTGESLKNYELNDPKSSLTFYDQANKAYKLFLGSQSFDKKRFFLNKKKGHLFLSDSHMNFAVKKTLNQFRSKKLFSSSWVFDKLVIKGKKETFVLLKKNDSWVTFLFADKKTPIILDQIKVSELIASFKHLEVLDFVRENHLNSKKLLKAYKLVQPQLLLSVFHNKKEVWHLSLSKSIKQDFVYAKTSKRSSIYSVSQEAYSSLSVGLKDLRDLTYMFALDAKKIDQVWYQVGKRRRKSWILKDGQWSFFKNKKLDIKKMTKLFSGITNLRVVKFLLKKNFANKAPLESFSFISKKKPILIISVLGFFSSQPKADLKDLVVLKLNNNKEYFAVSKVSWTSLKRSFLKKALKKKNNK